MKFTLTIVLSIALFMHQGINALSENRADEKDCAESYAKIDSTKDQAVSGSSFANKAASTGDYAKNFISGTNENTFKSRTEAVTNVVEKVANHWFIDLLSTAAAVVAGAEENEENACPMITDENLQDEEFSKRYLMNCWKKLNLPELTEEEKKEFLKNGMPMDRLMEFVKDQLVLFGPEMGSAGIRQNGEYFEIRDTEVRNPNAPNTRYVHIASPRRRITYE